jgi:hypothetical protein
MRELKTELAGICTLICVLFLAADALFAQSVTIDAAPSHVVNTFSPPHALGAAIDRLRTGLADHVLTDPLLKEILNAGWQTVTYRQNTELMVGGLALESERHME